MKFKDLNGLTDLKFPFSSFKKIKQERDMEKKSRGDQ